MEPESRHGPINPKLEERSSRFPSILSVFITTGIIVLVLPTFPLFSHKLNYTVKSTL
jgi:hypothetical protein